MSTHTIVLQPSGFACEAIEGTSILHAFEAAGIELPSSCRNGSCRTCLGRLVSGRVSYRIEWPGLTAEEQAAGDVLPCVAHPESDVCLATPGP